MPDRRKASAPRLDPVVVAALNDLQEFTYRRRQLWEMGRGVKREKSLHDPSARAGAIHLFKHLKHHRYHWEPEAVQAWATASGWSAQDAQRLGEYAAGVLAGTRYHTVPDPFGEQAIDHWREEAERSS